MGREGALWRGRFHSALVETGPHLSRCLFCLDMNMVRSGVVRHPRDWWFGGYQELSGARQQYRIIDQARLLNCLAMRDMAVFRQWHEATLQELCQRVDAPREPHWSRAFPIGGRNWLGQLTSALPSAETHIHTPAAQAPDGPAATCPQSSPVPPTSPLAGHHREKSLLEQIAEHDQFAARATTTVNSQLYAVANQLFLQVRPQLH